MTPPLSRWAIPAASHPILNRGEQLHSRGSVRPRHIGDQDMPAFRLFRRGAGCGLLSTPEGRFESALPDPSQASGDAGERPAPVPGSTPGPAGPPPFLSSYAGSRRAYRGRPARQHAQSARDTPGQHSHGSRDRCPVCAPGLWANTSFYVFFFWRSGKTGPRRAESRYQRMANPRRIPKRGNLRRVLGDVPSV